jgi:hypothetical protein
MPTAPGEVWRMLWDETLRYDRRISRDDHAGCPALLYADTDYKCANDGIIRGSIVDGRGGGAQLEFFIGMPRRDDAKEIADRMRDVLRKKQYKILPGWLASGPFGPSR